MSFSTESKETKEPVESKQTKETKKPKKLPPYEYKKLENADALRLLRLIPADDRQQDIDCQIIEIDIPKEGENSSDAPDEPKEELKESKDVKIEPPGSVKLDGLVNMLESYDGHVEEKLVSTSENEEEKEEPTPVKDTKSKEDDKKKTSYEAVSWCWGREPHDQVLRVHDGTKVFGFPISRNLKMALWALRANDEVRQLWIDAICINQGDTEERNQQVPRMDRIYGGAQNVCIWLGEESEDSKLAMEFIRDRVLELWKFDKLIENRTLAKHWAALIRLMKRPWFSRRWVVQEIALSPRGGTIYCGKDSNSWQDFADAVSLFVEVESATHRLSDVMKLDQSFGNIPSRCHEQFVPQRDDR
jgi:hypothetical protein